MAAPLALSAQPRRNVHWGLGAVTWVVRAAPASPRWEDILADIRAAGFEGFEPYTTPTLPVNDENMSLLEKIAPTYGLRASGIYWADQYHVASEHDRILKESHRFLGYLKRFGADRLIIGPPYPRVENEREAISNMAKVVNGIGKIALEQYQVKTGVHPHVDGLIENPRQIDQLMEETDPRYFNLAPDTSQIWMGGGDPIRMMEKYKNRLVYLHYKDCRGYYRGAKDYLAYETELGRGVIDFVAAHKILKSIGYQGWITIDIGRAAISPLETATVCKAYIDGVLSPIYA
jgi:inosose dehydratase